MTLELLLPVAFTAGLFGGTHCIGMCGAIVVLFENQAGAGRLPRRILYNTGRLGFYLLLGAVAGAFGTLLTILIGIDSGLMLLRLLAALLVIALGLNLLLDLKFLGFLERSGAHLWRRLAPLARHVLPVSTPGRAMVAGFIWGALPCGLVYSAVALAASSGSGMHGALIMLAFWLGTVPALLLAGAFAHKLKEWQSRTAYRRLAGIVLLIVGALAVTLWATKPADHSHDSQSTSSLSGEI